MKRCCHHHTASDSSGGASGPVAPNAENPPEERRSFLRSIPAGIIRGYQRFISPVLPNSCRFSPTCSEYARQAILKHGIFKGIWLGTRRILKCHPFHPGGYDPVP